MDPVRAPVLAELARINASVHLRRATQLQRLLSHIVHSALAGEASRLHEINLALECFRRSASRFDPHRDPIVRVAASRLRQKLASFYESDGAQSVIRIELPVGTYVPTFIAQRPEGTSAANPRGAAGSRRSLTNPEAQDFYDRARFALRQQNPLGYRKAIELLDRVTHDEPQFEHAWAALATAWLGLVGWVAVPALPEVESARRAATRALEIDPGLSEALVSLASIVFRYDLDFARAEPLYRQAIALDPSSRYAHHAFAFALTMNERFDEAEAEYRIARQLDPLDQTLRCQQALMPIYTGRYDAAEQALLAILDVDHENILARALLGATYLYSNQPSRALGEYQRIIDRAPTVSIGWCGRGQALAMLGLHREARAVLDDLIADGSGSFVSPYQIAMVHTRLGDATAAFEWLDRAGSQRDANFVCAPVDPAFADLRSTARWHALMQRYGLGIRHAHHAGPVAKASNVTPP